MANERIAGSQKAAIFLFSIGEELASAIMKHLDEEEIRRLGSSMSKILSISPKTMETIFAEFNELASSHLPMQIGQGGAQFIKNVLTKAIDRDKAETIIEEIREEGRWNLFQKIKRLDSKTVANFLRGEHPQTISIILAHLDSAQSGAILEEFPTPLQTEVIYRIADLESVPPNVVEEIDQAIQEEIAMVKGFEGQKRGGVRLAADILNQMDSSAENAVLKEIEEQRQSLAEEIRRLMFVFEDLTQVDDRSIMAIVKEVDNETLMRALKTASDELKGKIFKNMSERAAQMMKEDLEVMGPVRLKDVKAAQQLVLKIGKSMQGEGKIVLVGKGKEEVFV